MSWIMQPPYALACAFFSSSADALGYRARSSGLISVSQAESIIASWVSTEYADSTRHATSSATHFTPLVSQSQGRSVSPHAEQTCGAVRCAQAVSYQGSAFSFVWRR